mmetsp:Transcript_10544/g.38792  ORF Transcript_10544/g.38792 Transcript_10544/m.38792 type:complete len:226 (+) Transcript_10544:50-727(+)
MLRAAANRAVVALASGPSKRAAQMSTAVLPDLPYDYGALQPAISGEIMELHHKKHHQTYVNNLNATLDKLSEAERKGDLGTMLALQGALNFNGGGHVNHSIFWTNLTPVKDFTPPEGALLDAITDSFGSVENLQSKMNAAGAAVQGSGWAWLAFDSETGKLVVKTSANQNICASNGANYTPLLGIDVWEHAYYLQYKNVRPDYLKAIWEVVNWKNVGERLAAAKA